MADRPLRPATHRCLGEPLPHQQANGPRAHPDAEAEASFPTTVLRPRGTFGISPSFLGLSQSSGQVTHVLLTRSRLCPRASPGSSLHLHVLSTPPAFVLSQDQTLREELHMCTSTKSVAMPTAGCPRTRRGFPGIGRGLILAPPFSRSRWRGGRRLSKPGRTRRPDHSGQSVHMLLSFQRPPCLPEGIPPPDTRELAALGAGAKV